MLNKKDKEIIKKLANQIAEIAVLPIQNKRLKEWKLHNSLKQQRPMFMIDQICWNEMSVDDELTIKCEDEFAKRLEETLRRRIYKWNHLQDDNIVFANIDIPKIVISNGYGIEIAERTMKTDQSSAVASHEYIDMIKCEYDLQKINDPVIKYDAKMTQQNTIKTQELVGDILKVKIIGVTVALQLWDRIAELRGVETILYDIVDRPEFIHKIIKKFVDYTNKEVDILEEEGLIEPAQNLIHCSGAWTDELPAEGFDNKKARAKDSWTMGMAQMFSTISPIMHNEFEIEHKKALYERFGLVNYGCCEPLDRKIDMIRQIKNVRKISISPWADQNRAAEAMGNDYIFLRKPNPALLAGNFSEEVIKSHLYETLDVCKKYNCIPEFILKDISTINYKPQNLWRWAEIARNIFGG